MLITISEDMASQRGPNPPHQALTHSTSAPNRREPPVEGERRVRVLRLHRPPSGSYGFHLRGGREHGTGFFISHVEQGSEAQAKGLKIGDQVLKVNNLNVSRALHREVASIVQSHQEVVLEVKSTGLIPVKNNPNDPLSWVLVNGKECPFEQNFSSHNDSQILKFLGDDNTHTNASHPSENHLQIVMSGAGKYTIGCSICKGPPEKPGIFVQRVREGGVSEEAGLRPGDQILSCNGKSFLYIDFQQAVQIMKSSPNLRMELLRGAGIELIAGESSGYNSSASSETGEEVYPSSESDSRDCYTSSLASNLSSRLNSVRNQLHLDRTRDWKEIEAEWEEAEVSEKRTQLENTHTLLSRRSASNSTCLTPSKSLLSLTIREDEAEKNSVPFSKQWANINGSSFDLPLQRRNLNKQRSLSDLNLGKDPSNYKIALQTASDAHVSKIVIPSAPKDEQNALLRLEELSSSTSSLKLQQNYFSKPSKKETIFQSHSKTCSISSSSSEEFTPESDQMGNFCHLRRRQEDARQQVRICSKEKHLLKPVSADSLLNSEDSDSLMNYPSSRICITSENGRFTSKVIIRSPPPAPPPRANNTKLTRQQRKIRCPYRHHKIINNRLLSTNSYLNISSPPVSPSTSTDSSNEGLTCGHLVRHKSFGNLSISSEESISPWDEIIDSSLSSHCSIHVSSSNSKEPSLQSKRSTLPIGERRVTYKESLAVPIPPPPPSTLPISILVSSSKASSLSSSIPAPPPPPPPPPPPVPNTLASNGNFTSPALSLGSAISKELKNRLEQDVTGAVSKLKNPAERIRPKALADPKKQQHEQLMEEFKKAHALMFSKKKSVVISENISEESSHETQTSRL